MKVDFIYENDSKKLNNFYQGRRGYSHKSYVVGFRRGSFEGAKMILRGLEKDAKDALCDDTWYGVYKGIAFHVSYNGSVNIIEGWDIEPFKEEIEIIEGII